ncbi:MAG TPA: EAL domain-containing protein [Hyphomicrobium sp.]
MSAASPPTSETARAATDKYRGRSTPSRRLAQTIREQDVKGEKSIALAQGAIALFVLALHAFGFRHDVLTFDAWVVPALQALMASSAVRWWLASREPLPEHWLDALSVVDVGIVLSVIWSYQFAFNHPAGGVLKAPAFVLLLLLVGVRALRFHPRPVVVAGIAAVAGWSLLICCAVFTDGVAAVTNDYRAYLSSFRILPGAEAERVVALAGLAIVLAIGTYTARKMLGRAAHASDYRDALEAARQHLAESVRAREQAESALRALDRRDAELSEQNRLFNAALAKMSQGLCMFDQGQKLLVCNDRYIEMYGLSKSLAEPGTPFRKIIESRIANGLYVGENSEAYLDERLASAREAVRNTRLHELSDGRIIAITHEPLEGGGWVATHDDVTRLRRIEAKLSHMARHDALTDLPNRVELRERMQQVLAGDALVGHCLVVLLLEIDRFKEVNDTLGPSIGDALLQGVAQRLRRRLDGADMVARVGGDEFVVLQVADEPAAVADALIKRVRAVLGTSFDLDDHTVPITISVGVAIGPADGNEPDELLKNADLALGRAKVDGPGNSRFFEREMDERVRARHKLEHDMRLALREGQFELYYQPQLNLESGEISGFEALLRWNHPERGLILPSEFVSLAEETGFIVPLGEWVLREACQEASGWPKRMRVAVNLSVAQFRSGQVRQSVIAALGASALSPGRLELEITESVLMQEDRHVAEVLGKLQDIGVGLALDDFGTGFSSLSYLTRIRFDKIKIDKHFIRELRDDPNSSLAVLRSVVALARSLGITTVAEGVETKEQLHRVRAEGCTEAQGFYVGLPMPANQIPALVAVRKRKPQRDSRRAG